MEEFKRKRIVISNIVYSMSLGNGIGIIKNVFFGMCILFCIVNVMAKSKKGLLYQPVEWVYENVTYSGNPFDVIAEATFTHREHGENIKTELFYSGENSWTLRFTGIRTGEWVFTTKSRNNDLNNLSGKVIIEENSGILGFITSEGNKWTRMGMDELAFVPNYVMYYTPDGYYNKPELIDVEDLQVIPKTVLDTTGFSADLSFNPVDRSLHATWVNSGDIFHVFRDTLGIWHPKEKIPDGGYDVYGQEEANVPRKCLAITFDEKGILHLVFAERGGDVFYLTHKNSKWNTPVRIIEKPPYTIYLDLEKIAETLYCVYEDGNQDVMYTLTYKDDKWSSPTIMGPSEYPSLTAGGNGRIYFMCRNNRMNNYNTRLAYRTTDNERWTFLPEATDAPRRLGQGPGLAVHKGRMYIAWSNSTGISGPKKSSLHCAFAYEPGINWNPRIGGEDPLYYENTGDPHPRVAVFSDGTVLYMNGKRTPRFMIWNGTIWSQIRKAPWQSGILQVQCDGKTVWVISSESSKGSGEVSVSGIVHPTALVVKDG